MEIQSADRRLRLVATLLLLGAMMLALVALLLLEHWITGVQALSPERALGKLRVTLLWLLAAGCVSLLGFGAWMWRLGRAIQKAQRFPLPGARVIRDTRVLAGEEAVRRGRLAQGLGTLLLLGAAALAVFSWHLWGILAVVAG